MLPDPRSITCVASIGGGPIGAGWAAHFLARGYDVNAYIHDNSERTAFNSILQTGWKSLTDLGLSPNASLDRLKLTTDWTKLSKGPALFKKVPQNALN